MKVALTALVFVLLSGCASSDSPSVSTSAEDAAFLDGISWSKNRSRDCLVTRMGRGVVNLDCD